MPILTVWAESQKVGLLASFCKGKRVPINSLMSSQGSSVARLAYLQALETGRTNTAWEDNSRAGLLLSNLKASAGWAQPHPPSWSLPADLDGDASERVSRTHTCAPHPHPSGPISHSFLSLWLHLDFGCYLT